MHRPVVTTQIAGISELLEDGVGGWRIPAAPSKRSEAACAKRWRLRPRSSSDSAKAGAARVREAHNPAVEIPKLAALFDAALRQRSSERRVSVRSNALLRADFEPAPSTGAGRAGWRSMLRAARLLTRPEKLRAASSSTS